MLNCYSPCYRLKKKHEFSSVFEANKKLKTHFFLFFYYKNTKTCQPKLGVVVSKKIMPRAVDRNQIKRLHRECFRTSKYAMPAWHIVVVARYSLQHQPQELIRRELNQSWGKLLRCLAN